jgi:hypothetical protein
MVHGGNSGGPIVDAETLLLIGIVTQRRFFGDPEMRRIDNEMKELQDGTAQWATHGSVQIMGIDFGAFAGEIAKIARVTNDLIRLNSTTGIGVGYPIIELTTRCREKGLL